MELQEWIAREVARTLLALCDECPEFRPEGMEELRAAVEELPPPVLH